MDVNDAAEFLVKHHVPFVGPDVGNELLKIIKRLDEVEKVYPLSETLEAYRASLNLVLVVAMNHQSAFCNHMEKVLSAE